MIEDEIIMGFDAQQMVDLDRAEKPHMVDLEVSIDPSAHPIFGGEGYLNVAYRFNAANHTATIVCDQQEIISGRALLMGVNRSDDKIVHSLRIIREVGAWVSGSGGEMFNKLPIVFEERLLISTINSGWTDDEMPVKFFPVHRDSYNDSYTASVSDAVIRLRSIDDYHPFINIYEVIKRMFESDGYTIVSQLFSNDWFGKLYMSGVCHAKERGRARCDGFLCAQVANDSAVGSSSGRVYSNSSPTNVWVT